MSFGVVVESQGIELGAQHEDIHVFPGRIDATP